MADTSCHPTHVISFEEGLTSTGRFPYVLARLACGHVASVQLRATTGTALDPSTIHHARFDPRFAPGSYHLYRHDVASPSGFFLIGSVPATPTFDEALRRIRVSPISPTECA